MIVVLFSLVCTDLAVTAHVKIAIVLRIILIKIVKFKIKSIYALGYHTHSIM